MNYIDLLINLIESTIVISFVYRVFNHNKQIFSFLIAILLYFVSVTTCNILALPEIIMITLSIAVLFGYSNYLNSHNHMQNIFIALFVNVLLNVSASISIFLATAIFDLSFLSSEFSTFMVVCSKLILLILTTYTSKLIKRYHFLQSKVLKYITLSILLLNAIYSIIIDYIFLGDNFNFTLNLTLLLIDALTLCLCIVFFEAQKEQQTILELQRKNLKIENLETIQAINEENYQNIRKWKHDVNHIFNSIKYHLNIKNYEKVNEILNNYPQSLNTNHFLQPSGNELLDYLLLQKVQSIKNNNIHLIIDCSNNISPLDETHFFIIVGNLIDNAIENCGPHDNKQLWISIGTKPEYFYIRIKNTITDSILTNNPNLNTTKENSEQHGIGLNNVKLLVQHYQGLITFEEEDNYFIVKILIPINNH